MKLSRILRALGFTTAGGAAANFSMLYLHQNNNPWLLLVIGILAILAAWIIEGREIKKQRQDRVARRFEQLVGQVRMM